ncbi:hypothetical protein KHA80_00910 [Anaerobacillus sp. HL2]|nr:hypothetical protein KHA80_00910 [Anaerobacillus sp. HL2]
MTKRKHFRNAASKSNLTPTESVYNEEMADENVDIAKANKKKISMFQEDNKKSTNTIGHDEKNYTFLQLDKEQNDGFCSFF